MLRHRLAGEGGDVQLDGGNYGPMLVHHLAGPGVGLLGAYELGPGALVHGEVGQQLVVAADEVFVAGGLDDELVERHVGLLEPLAVHPWGRPF